MGAYLCIDLRSFYASVECVERGLDPMTARLVVADPARTEKTICLAVSPALKALGVPGRCRVFEIPKHLSYEMAPPRMQLYIDYSTKIYQIYQKYISEEDIHVYSIDEAFLDVTHYLALYGMTAEELGRTILDDIRRTLGLCATCGVGTNLYLCKIALDILAKHARDGIGILDEASYRARLWEHRPLTDFWRVGRGTAARLARIGVFTMGALAKIPEETLYKMFGVDAELLIDHAWGREPTTIADIKAYRPQSNSFSSGQVLPRSYARGEGGLIVREMTENLALELAAKELCTDSAVLELGYEGAARAHGSVRFDHPINSARQLRGALAALYARIAPESDTLRRVTITFAHLTAEGEAQLTLFTPPRAQQRERQMQRAMVEIRQKFGKNALLRGINLQAGGTMRERNGQIGGHRA